MIELILLKYFLKLENYSKYRDNLKLKTEDKELRNLYSVLDSLLASLNRDITFDEYRFSVLSEYPDYDSFLDQIASADVGEEVLLELVRKATEKSLAYDCALVAIDVSEGRRELPDLIDFYSRFESSKEELTETVFVTDDLEELYNETVHTPGLRWRLKSLNQSLGSLRKGDFGFLFARPESFSRDTEILTPQGWITVDKVTQETYIAQVNSDLTTTFVQPEAIHPHEQTHCYHIHDELGRVDLIVTEGHGMVYEKKGKLWKERADTVKYYQGVKHHVTAAASITDQVDFLPTHRLEIAYQADGHTRNYKEYGYTFSFKKERKQQRLKEILGDCGYEYSEYKDGNRGHIGYYVKSKIKLHKHFDWVDLSLVSKEWCRKFIEELSYWDATRRTDTRFKFDTTNREVADKVQAISILAGYNCLLSVTIDSRSPNYNDVYSLTIRTNYQPVDGQCIVKEKIPFTDTTYCFEVPSGMLLVRRNGAVAISGNTGKTTFLASEVSYFAQQTDKPILWANNEEQGNKVKIRCYQAALGITLPELYSDREKWYNRYMDLTNGNIKIYDSASISKRQVEKLCKELNPALVIFDQIDKIKGFDADRNDLRLGSIYIWARELAKSYCPVIGVCQSDVSGEGKKWLNMDNVAESKTSKQAEADWILGIGRTHDIGMENVRYLHLSKNKLSGDSDSIPEMRHGRMEVLIKPEIARYVDYGA